MKILIVGMGYVGLTMAIGLAELGNSIICYDINSTKISGLIHGNIPIYEHKMESLYLKNKKHLIFTDQLTNDLRNIDIIFLSIGTPSKSNGEVDTNNLFQAVHYIGMKIAEPVVIINRSTVPPGTTSKIEEVLHQLLKIRHLNFKCPVIFSPEFLHEGQALDDFFSPDRIVIGQDSDDKKIAAVEELFNFYKRKNVPILFTNTYTAELLKYINNLVASLKISFINEVADICEANHVNVWELIKLLTYDKRVSPQYLSPGIGFGGSCLPKDTQAIEWIAKKNNINIPIISEILKTNAYQIDKAISKIYSFCAKGHITIWGTAFKEGTDDIRDSQAIKVIEKLIEKGDYVLNVFDPKSLKNTKKALESYSSMINYYDNIYSSCKDSNAIIILTKWHLFSKIDLIKVKNTLKSPVIIDFQNVIGENKLQNHGFIYYIRGISDTKE